MAVISPDFSENLFDERLKLMKIAANIDDRIEPHPFRVKDFDSSNPLASEIQKHGILILGLPKNHFLIMGDPVVMKLKNLEQRT